MVHIRGLIEGMVDGPLRAEIGGVPAQFGVNLGNAGFYLHQRPVYGAVTETKVILRFLGERVALVGGAAVLGTPKEFGRYEAGVTRTPALDWCWILGGRPCTSDRIAEFIVEQLVRLNELERLEERRDDA
jgi:hypothetical protein